MGFNFKKVGLNVKQIISFIAFPLNLQIILADAGVIKLFMFAFVLLLLVKDRFDIRDQEIESVSELEVGQIVRGYIKSCTDVGVFVT